MFAAVYSLHIVAAHYRLHISSQEHEARAIFDCLPPEQLAYVLQNVIIRRHLIGGVLVIAGGIIAHAEFVQQGGVWVR